MADNTLLNLAKQGKPGAIAAMLNRSFQKEGWTCKGRTNGNELKLTFEGENPPQLDQIRDRLMRGLKTIQPEGIEVLNLEARKTGQLRPVWSEVFYLTGTEVHQQYSEPEYSDSPQSSDQMRLVYNPEFALKVASRLRNQAKSLLLGYSIFGGLFGLLLGLVLGGFLGFSGFIGTFLMGLFLGLAIGISSSLSIEGQAQLLYAQIQTEINTRSLVKSELVD